MMDRNLKIAVGIGVAAIIVMLYLIYSGYGGVPISYVSTRETETQRMSKALQFLTAPENKTPSAQTTAKSAAPKYSPVSRDIIESLTAPQSH